MKIILEFFQKPFHIKILLIKASLWSIYYKRKIDRTEFRELAAKMGEFRYETPSDPIEDNYIDEIRWIMYAIERWAFWDTRCFDRALTAKKLLNEKGFSCTLYLGVKKDKGGSMIAHAWVRCGNRAVAGGRGAGYAVTGIYGDRKVMHEK